MGAIPGLRDPHPAVVLIVASSIPPLFHSSIPNGRKGEWTKGGAWRKGSMAQHQTADRAGIRHLAAQTAGLDRKQPTVFAAQALTPAANSLILRMIGGALEDSTEMEIVNPATG